MLNKPKFMSPSINMYGNSVIDLNSATLPFSCIVDGNEAIVAWKIVISKLEDNIVVFDSDKQILDKPFYPINNRNQNIVFNINLRDYFSSAKTCYIQADATYDPEKTYYTGIDNEYNAYTYDSLTWETDYASLYYVSLVNSASPYYWNITFYGKTGTITSSAEEVFYANTTPKTAIYYSYDNNFLNEGESLNNDLAISNVLSKRKIFLKATYSQNEKVSLKRYGWRLTDTSNGNVIIDTITQNQIYGLEDDISCECNGLVNKTKYLVELYIETQNGYFDIIQSVNFDVDYTVKNIDADFNILPLNNSSGIMLNWGDLKTTEGVVVGNTVDYITNLPVYNSVSIEIPNDSSVVFTSTSNGKDLEIDENSHIVLSFQFDKDENITLFEMSGVDEYFDNITRKLSYTASNRELKYTIKKGNVVTSDVAILSEYPGEICWYVATLYPLFTDGGYSTKLRLIESIAEGGLYPSEDIYPSEDVYPTLGEWNKLRKNSRDGD